MRKLPPKQRIRFNLTGLSLGDSFYAFELARPGVEDRFADAEQSIPSILYWLSASPEPALRWNPLDPELHMLRPAPVDVPAWADPAYVRHTIDAFQQIGFRGGLNYYSAFPKTFELMAAFRDGFKTGLLCVDGDEQPPCF